MTLAATAVESGVVRGPLHALASLASYRYPSLLGSQETA